MSDATFQAHESSERMVDVGGHRLHLLCVGTDWPTVVLDAGMGDTSTSREWSSIQQSVAAFTQCCGYERSGLGTSEAGSGQYTSLRAVEELHSLLHSAEIAMPVVLVGHSLGGLHAQLFAMRYPDEVAGLVLIDATHEDHFGWLERNLLSDDEMDEQRRMAAGDNPEGIAMDAALSVLQQARWRLDVPLIVLMRDSVPSEEQPPEWTSERETRLLATWRDVQTDLASRSPQGRLVVAEGSGHNIQRYRPDLVIEAIREVVDVVRRNRQNQNAKAASQG